MLESSHIGNFIATSFSLSLMEFSLKHFVLNLVVVHKIVADVPIYIFYLSKP